MNINLEFIRTTGSLRGRAKRQRPRRQVKKDRRCSYRYVENIFGRQRRPGALQLAAVELVVWIDSTSVERALQIHLFMQNEPNFLCFLTKNDGKAKKRTQYEPNQSQFWPNNQGIKAKRTQFKPNRSQFPKGQKMMQSFYLHRDKKIKQNWGFVKTKPIKPNNQSSACALGIINNHLKGKHNSKPIQSQFALNAIINLSSFFDK